MENQEHQENQINQINQEHQNLTEKITDQNVFAIKKELIELKEELKKFKIEHLAKELQFPVEVVEQSDSIKPFRRTKRGKGYSPLLEAEIVEAQANSDSANGAAKYLRVHYCTYKKYAKLYGIWKTNIHATKEGKIIVDPEKGKYPISRLLKGEFPNFPVFKLKNKLIRSGIKKAECEVCGFNEQRITDGKLPLLLNFEDGNSKNHKLENLKLLCYNHTFICGKGYIRQGRKYHALSDPDRAQGANVYVPKKF